VPRDVVKTRARRLRALGSAALSSRLQTMVGSEQDLLVEKQGFARTPCFAQVALKCGVQPGTFVCTRITGATATHLIADLA